LHNIGRILDGDQACSEDQEYRRLYLQPYDSVWVQKGWHLKPFWTPGSSFTPGNERISPIFAACE
jgi:hypothetical protein